MAKDEKAKEESTDEKESSATIVKDKSNLKGAETPQLIGKPPTPGKIAPTKDKPVEQKVEAQPEITLDDLSVEVVDGIGSKVTNKLKPIGITTLEKLAQVVPENITLLTKIPTHRLMEHQQKAARILEIELDSDMIDQLAAKNYTIEQAIGEKIGILQNIFKKSKDEVRVFLGKVVQITMFLDAMTCRNNSISILHRRKKEKPKIRMPPPGTIGSTLDTLSVESIDGIGPEITEKLSNLEIYTLADLEKVNPAGIYKAIGVPLNKLIELSKKVALILGLDIDDNLIDVLAEKGYTIGQTIEEDPKKIRTITKRRLDDVMEFLENVIQVTLFLDTETYRAKSVIMLRKSENYQRKDREAGIEYDEIRYLGREQILAKIYSSELGFTIFKLLRERARNKSEILKILEGKLMKPKLSRINEVIDLLVQTELVQMEWFEGNFDVHLFLISDFEIMRTPVTKIIEECQKNRPSPLVAEQYLSLVGKFFDEYKPTSEDNELIAEHLQDSDIFVTLTLLRNRMYPLKKFPKGMGDDAVDMLTIIRKMEEAGIVKIFKDETKEDWVILLTDLRAPQFYPEYMIENIRKDALERKVAPQMATKHLDLLELHYDTFFEIYNKFFRE